MAESPLNELRRRGLIAQTSGEDQLEEHLSSGSRTLYCGFDPTAPSLHIGNLLPLLVLRRFQLAGHRPVALVGGATGLIGDPSFKSGERSLNPRDVVAGWVERIRHQVASVLDFEGDNGAMVVDNLDWTQGIDVLTFLRDFGKHFSVNAMIQKESVRARIERDNEGISYTEFSYQLLQALDYRELARQHACTLQIGGSDQWGNITAGMDLIRRMDGGAAHVLTVPLITRSDGVKFGKTEGGAVWLDPEMTSPYAFYQYWLNAGDEDAEQYLLKFGFRSAEEEDELLRGHREEPHRRIAQKAIGEDLTRLLHGDEGWAAASRITDALFSGELAQLAPGDLDQLALDGLPAAELADDARIGEALVAVGLAKSNGNAMQLVRSGAVAVNGAKIEDPAATMAATPALHDRAWMVRRGKRQWALIRRVQG